MAGSGRADRRDCRMPQQEGASAMLLTWAEGTAGPRSADITAMRQERSIQKDREKTSAQGVGRQLARSVRLKASASSDWCADAATLEAT